jgi:hypothetical protein
MKALYFSIILFVGARAAYCDQIVTTLVTETSVDLKSWTPIDTNIVTSTGYAKKYRLNIYTKKIDNSFFLKALVGEHLNIVSQDGVTITTSSNETLYYNEEDPGGLPTYMMIYVNSIPTMFITFGGNRLGQAFGLSLSANGIVQYISTFQTGNVYF